MGPAVHKEHLEKNLEEVQVLGGTGSEKDWSDDYWRSKIRFSGDTMQRSGEDKRKRAQEERRQDRCT